MLPTETPSPTMGDNSIQPLGDATSELERIRRLVPELLPLLQQMMLIDPCCLPLLHAGGQHKVIRLSEAEAGPIEDWFFIGDIHGDFFALNSLIRHAERTSPACRIFFLGDMVDRGDMPVECIFLLLDWGRRHPGRLAWIAGNHDIAVRHADATFHSEVIPGEFAEQLNLKHGPFADHEAIGRFFIDLAGHLPRAMLFPTGLFATHGGFPHTDRQAKGAACEDEATYLDWLNAPSSLEDISWTRIHRAPRKMPDRYSRGSEYGYRDFEAFCALKPEWFPATHMVTGHCHPPEGFALHPTYKLNPALTLLGLGYDDTRSMPAAYASYVETLYLGRGHPGGPPEVITVPVDKVELRKMYPAAKADQEILVGK